MWVLMRQIKQRSTSSSSDVKSNYLDNYEITKYKHDVLTKTKTDGGLRCKRIQLCEHVIV